MARINLYIGPISGYTPTERAQAISAELFAITRPPIVRQPADVGNYLFAWHTHPLTGEAILVADDAEVIRVNPLNDLTNLVALLPALSQEEKNGLEAYIENSQTFLFGDILPQDYTVLTDAQLAANGWFDYENE